MRVKPEVSTPPDFSALKELNMLSKENTFPRKSPLSFIHTEVDTFISLLKSENAHEG